MPVVTIKLAGSFSREQKKQIAEEITGALERWPRGPMQWGSASGRGASRVPGRLHPATRSHPQRGPCSALRGRTLERVGGKPRRYTYIAFEELPDANWAIAGQLLDNEVAAEANAGAAGVKPASAGGRRHEEG